ncbi:amidase domain-containing protein [Staphylococcus agnetis]|uniref:amidase domain-containing protein n=1 Tax=Staphylococcus agnetis TaxID=985762 RepID=UPI0021D160B5|nr:amidase domain-containing protein [Staphylococcus agnetis]UXU59669.1 amidase domain-containing protein [Staphylococcus agnetis]UXU61997.1 amidase domain-containing protein [Staphylococcus agnetis]
MKTHKLLICMLSTTLVFPSYSVSMIHAESTKDASDNPTIEAPSTEQSHVSKSSDEKQEDTKKDDDKTKSSAQKSKTKMSKPTAPSWLPSWLDTFNHPLDVIHPTRQHSTHFWDNWLTLDPPTDSISKDVNTTENDPNLSQSTPSTAHSDIDPTTNETTTKEAPSSHDASTSESTSEPSRDNSHLSEGDQAVANELDNITDKIQSNQPSDKDTSSETPNSKHDETSSNEAPTTEDHHTEGKTTENNDTSTTSDHVDDALIDAYGKDKKSTPDTKTNEKDTKKGDLPKHSNETNTQLPSQKEIKHSEIPKQSFEDGVKASNFRSRATFVTLPQTSNTSSTSNPYIVTENKDTRAFIKSIAKDAHDIGQKENIYASVMIAQAILESDSGNSALARAPHYNLFGIKGAYHGHSATFNTLEDNGGALYQISASFRSYPDEKASLQDYADLIKNGIDGNPYIYKPTWKSDTTTYKDATAHLATTYATDSHYADKLNSIIKHYNLTQFDHTSMPDMSNFTVAHEASASHFKPFTEAASGAAYPQGQCTWYVYNRMAQFGLHIGGHLGDARDWDQHAANDGYSVRSIPSEHSAVVFEPGQLGADAYYGHVAFVEKVNSDGSIVISESNVKGLGVISYRTIDASDAELLSYIKGK